VFRLFRCLPCKLFPAKKVKRLPGFIGWGGALLANLLRRWQNIPAKRSAAQDITGVSMVMLESYSMTCSE
jgi:hypothetical protein